MREYVTMQCSECKSHNYRTQKNPRNTRKLEIKKHCRVCRKHTKHNERKK